MEKEEIIKAIEEYEKTNGVKFNLEESINLLKNQMQIIPFRIKAHEDPENYADVYCFLIKGTEKDPYEIEIDIDNLNDLGITDERCTCKHYQFRQTECKHIKEAKRILEDFGIHINQVND